MNPKASTSPRPLLLLLALSPLLLLIGLSGCASSDEEINISPYNRHSYEHVDPHNQVRLL